MSVDFTKLFGGGGATLGPTLATNFFESRTWTAPQDGIVIVRGMGAGGGGARAASSPYTGTGGYSGSWGCKIVRVKKGDTISVAIGAGGVGGQLADSNGKVGGNTIITIKGVQYIAYGGPGGVFGGTKAHPNGPSPSTNWDFGAASVKPGWVSGGVTGGAGVDILAQGNNATTSDSVAASGGGGTGSKSIGTIGGGAMPGGKSAAGSDPTNPGIVFDASQGEWGISFYGGNGGGIGGGGGGGISAGGNGGQGFAHLKFYADMGV